MADKNLYPLEIAMRTAERVISYIQLACQDYGIAGSVIAMACVDDAIGILDWQLRGGEGLDIVEVGR
jgi:hypothetical protein